MLSVEDNTFTFHYMTNRIRLFSMRLSNCNRFFCFLCRKCKYKAYSHIKYII